MAPQRSDSRPEFVDKRSEVLTDSTDLDTLLAAILDDESAPASVKAWPRPVGEARPEPTFVAPPRTAHEPVRNFTASIAPDDAAETEKDGFNGFLAEVGSKNLHAVEPRGAVAGFSAPTAKPDLSPTQLDIVPVPPVRLSLIVTGLAALVALGGVYFLYAREARVGPPALAAGVPELVPAPSTVEPQPAAAVTGPSEVVDLTPAREPTAQPRVTSTPSRPPASDRTNPVRAEVQPPSLPSPSGASVGAPPPAVPEPVAEGADRTAAPAQIAPPDIAAPTPPSSPPAPEAVAPPVAGGADPVVTASALPVPAGAARATPPRLLTSSVPEYPAALRTARVGGNVEVQFTIDSSGRVINARSLTGPPQLRSVAEAAVRRWRYEPARLGNVAVDTETSVSFNFDPLAQRRPQD